MTAQTIALGLGAEHVPALWLLLAIPAGLVLWLRSRRPSGPWTARLSLTVRTLLVAALVLALAGIRVERSPATRTVVVVADRSASVGHGLDAEASTVVAVRDSLRGDDRLGVVSTAQSSTVEVAPSVHPHLGAFTAQVNQNGTDLEAGLRLADVLLPTDQRSQVVLLSDGRQNHGDALAQARLLAQRGARLDVLPVQVDTGPEVIVDELRAPSTVGPQSAAQVRVLLTSTVGTSGQLHVTLDGAPLETRTVDIPVGDSSVQVGVPAQPPGFHTVTAVIDPVVDTRRDNNVGSAVIRVLGTQHVALVEGHPGAGANEASALTVAGIAVDTMAPERLPADAAALGAHQAIVLVDVGAAQLGTRRMTAIVDAVKGLGVGLATIGGPDTYGPGGFGGTPLEAALPVQMQVNNPDQKAPVAVVLVLESVEDATGEAVVQGAARAVVRTLDTHDYVGVATGTQGLSVPLTPLTDRDGLLRALGGSTTFGDPDAYDPFIAAARDALDQYPQATRHIVVLGDGDASPVSPSLLDSLVRDGITVSSVGVDIDHNPLQMTLMRHIAELGHGRYYQSETADDVPTILLDETNKQLRPWIVQQSFRPTLVSPDATLAGVDLASLPAIDGYVATVAKPAATVVLRSPLSDPVLAQWQYGLGRVVAWTSDAEGRWTSALLRSSQGGRFLANLVAGTLPLAGDPGVTLSATVHGDSAHVVVAIDTAVAGDQDLATTVMTTGPDHVTAETHLVQTVRPRFEGDVPADQVGTYLLRATVTAGGKPFRVASGGLSVAYSPEFRLLGTDRTFLAALAQAGGGVVLGSATDVGRQPVPPVKVPTPLSTLLLLIAIVLLPADVALRRLILRQGDAADWRAAVQALSETPQARSAPIAAARLRDQARGAPLVRRPRSITPRVRGARRPGPAVREATDESAAPLSSGRHDDG